MDALTLEQVKGYRIDEVLGRGRRGTVLAATDPDRGLSLAVKVVRGPWVAHPAVRIGFAHLAEALMSLRHPHIVRVLDYEVDQDRLALVLERVSGETLETVLREFRARHKRVPLRQALRWVEALGGALEYAHQRGLFHRYLHPGHVLLGADLEPRLTDFGIDYLLEQASGEEPPPEAAPYLAPELRRGETGGPASDVYSLARVFLAVLACPEAPDRAALARVRPRALRSVIVRGLAEDPAERYATPRAFLRDIFAATRGVMPAEDRKPARPRLRPEPRVSSAAPPAAAAGRPAAASPAIGSTQGAGARSQGETGRRVLALLTALALGAALVFGAWRWARSVQETPSRPARLAVGTGVRVTVPGGRSVSVLRGCPTEFFQGVLGVATDGQSGRVVARRWCEDGWWYKVEIPALADSDWGGVGWIEQAYLSPK